MLTSELKVPDEKSSIETTTKEYLDPETGEHPFVKVIREFGRVLEGLDMEMVGRDKELDELDWQTNTTRLNTILIHAPKGTGKTFLVKGWGDRLARRGEGIIFEISLSKLLGSDSNPNRSQGEATADEILANLVEIQKDYQDRLRFLRNEEYEVDKLKGNEYKVVIFMDEIHKLGQMNQGAYAETLKEALGGDVQTAPIITATTDEEFKEYLFGNLAFVRRFTEKKLPMIPKEMTMKLGRNILTGGIDNVDEAKINETLNTLYETLDSEISYLSFPSKMTVYCDLLVSYVKRTKETISANTAKKVISSVIGVDLLKTFDIEGFEREVPKSFFGQELAKKSVVSILKSKTYGLPKRGNTYGNMFFIGPTGVGKTQMAKLVAKYGFGGHMVRMNMVNYMSEDSGEQFLTDLGNKVFQESSAVILIDEIEKSDSKVWQKLLVVMDEGEIDFRLPTGNLVTLSVRNCMFIATSNLGHKIMNNINANTENEDSGEDVWNNPEKAMRLFQNKKGAIQTAIQKAFSEEFAGRFTDPVMFVVLTLEDKINILEMYQREMKKMFRDSFGIKLNFPPIEDDVDFSKGVRRANSIDQFIIDTQGENAGDSGARQYKNKFQTLAEDALVKLVDEERSYGDNKNVTLHDFRGREIYIEPDEVALGKTDADERAGGFVAKLY